jgi:hypothetical protein
MAVAKASTTTKRTTSSRSRPRPAPKPQEPAPAAQPEVRVIERVAVQVPAEPVFMRTCSYCSTKMPLADLVPVADSLRCRDFDPCTDRAIAAGLLPQIEDELGTQPPGRPVTSAPSRWRGRCQAAES